MSVETKEHVARAVGTYLFIFCLVFGMAATVKSDALKKQVINKGAWLTGVFVQFVILPFLGFALVKSLSLSSPVGITLLILTSSPGGTYSNWFCSIFNGELALSITMTVISTIIGLVMLPCNLILYISLAYSGEAIQTINYAHLYISLVTVIIAIISGLFCSTKIHSSHFNLFANRMGNISGMSLLVFTFLILMYAQDTAVNLWGQSWQFYLGLATPCIFGLALATMFGTFFKLRKEERVAVATECCYQNVSICTLVAMVMFPPSALSEALVVPLYYGLVQLVVLGTYCIIAWKLGWTKAPVDESFFVVISKSYEALEETKRDDSSSYPQNSGDLQLIPTAHVLNENFNDDIVSVSLQKTIVMPKSKQYTVEINEGNKESYDDDRKVVRPKLPFFKNKSKVMEANEPTISPTSTLSPQAFEHTTKNGRNFRMGKRNSIRKSLAVQQALYIEETIIEDSLAEDPDISIAGESDLESGLSVSRHADDTSLAGFTWKRPFSRGSDNDNATGGVDVGNGFSQPPSAAFRAHTPPSNSTSNYKTQMHEERNVTPPRSNTTAPPIIIDNATDTIEIPFMEENDVESANKPSTSISSNTISSPPTILSSDTNSSSDKKNDESVINDAIDSSNMMQTAISSRAPSTPLTSTEQSNKIKTSNEAISLNMTTTNSPTSVLISENKTEDPDAADLAQVILSENKTEDPNVGNLAQLQSSTSSSLTATPSSIGKLPLVKDEATIPIAGDTTIKMISSSTDDEVDVAVESNEKAVELAVENIDSNAFTSRGKDGIDLNTNTHRDAGKEFENNSIGSQSKKLEKANNLELNSRTQMKDSNEIDDYSLGKFSI